MWMRLLTGGGAVGLYAWRIEDPKGAYAAFYDAANWMTGWFIGEGAVMDRLRSLTNLVLVDQVEGFLMGVAFFALISALLWPVRAGGRWGWRRLRRAEEKAAPESRT